MTFAPIRIAATADLHIRINDDLSPFERALRNLEFDADMLLMAGDLTDLGRLPEMDLVAQLLEPVSIPVFATLGNHDRRNVRRTAQIKLLRSAGVRILDGTGAMVTLANGRSVGIAGVTGTGGGFTLEAEDFGRSTRFTRTVMAKSRRESARLRKVLEELRSQNPDVLIVMTHFSPTTSTLGNEPPLKHWMLGNALLGSTIDAFSPNLVIHGHTHLGNENGQSAGGVPVRNVALPVVKGIRLITLDSTGTIVEEGLRPIEGLTSEISVQESDVR